MAFIGQIGDEVGYMRRLARTVEAGMGDYLRAYRKAAEYRARKRIGRGVTTSSMMFEAYADTIARVIADDIARGEWGGTYLMDGRPLNTDDPSLYGVGGAVCETEIPLDEGESAVYTEVLAACELLREVISDLQSTSDDLVTIGFWKSEERGVYCFYVSNVIRGYYEALALGRERGEEAIYHYATDTEIRCAMRSCGGRQRLGAGWIRWNDRRHGR